MDQTQLLEAFGTIVYRVPGLPRSGIYVHASDIALINSDLPASGQNETARQLLSLVIEARLQNCLPI